MDAHRGKPKGEAVSLSASLSAFVDLFEFFSETIRDLRSRDLAAITEWWLEYFGEDVPSFEKELDEAALDVLELQLRLMILLTETKLEELRPHGDDPFALSDGATRYRKLAESKLMDLYYRIHSVRRRLGHELVEEPEPSPRIQSESGIKMDLMLDREEEEAPEEFVGADADSIQAGDAEDETLLEVAGVYGEIESDAAGKDNKSALDEERKTPRGSNGDIIGEEPEEQSDETHSAVAEQQEMEADTEAAEASSEKPETHGQERSRRPGEAEEAGEDVKSAEKAAAADKADKSENVVETDVEDKIEEVEKAEIHESPGPKLVRSEQMVGAGRYDGFDRPEKDDRKKQDQQEDVRLSVAKPGGGERVEKDETKSLKVPPSPARRSDIGDEGVPLFSESSSKQDRLDIIVQRINRLKKVHRDVADLKVKTASGAWTLSLPYFCGLNGSGQPAALLDLENFIGIHNLAFRGVLDVAAKNESVDSEARMSKIVQKLHLYFRRLYGNIALVIGGQGSRILPDTGECLEPDVFLLLEADLVLFGWKDPEDVRQFRDIFQRMIAKPFNEYMTSFQNKISYLESVADLLEPGDEWSSARG